RKQLHVQPRRDVGGISVQLSDWPVPVVYEAAPIALFPKRGEDRLATVDIDEAGAAPERGDLDPLLPAAPPPGFFGRDETLLAIDRAFDSQPIVLLHAFAGSGKTATAAEFGRWYSLTGGIEGPILFSSFEQYTPLPRVLETFERIFGPTLQHRG